MGLQLFVYKQMDGSWQPNGEADLEEHVEKLMATDAFDLITIKPSKPNCKSFMEENDGHMPPGVEYTKEIVVQIRKGKSK